MKQWKWQNNRLYVQMQFWMRHLAAATQMKYSEKIKMSFGMEVGWKTEADATTNNPRDKVAWKVKDDTAGVRLLSIYCTSVNMRFSQSLLHALPDAFSLLPCSVESQLNTNQSASFHCSHAFVLTRTT